MWIGTVQIDEDKTDVGYATAIWNQGLADQFVYARRARMNIQDKNTFIAEAKKALQIFQSRTITDTNFSSILTGALNS